MSKQRFPQVVSLFFGVPTIMILVHWDLFWARSIIEALRGVGGRGVGA